MLDCQKPLYSIKAVKRFFVFNLYRRVGHTVNIQHYTAMRTVDVSGFSQCLTFRFNTSTDL